MNNVVLIPGSFNPVTNAHIELAKIAQKAVNAEKVFFIPAHDTYVAKKKTLIPGLSRCRLINEATPDDIQALSLEVNSFLPMKTYDTISKLREEYDCEYMFYKFYLCLGMDNIRELSTWYNWKPLVDENHFIACKREGESLHKALSTAGLLDYQSHFTEIEISENHTSSSLVRELCENGKFDEVSKFVPNNVYDYLRRFYDVLDRI